ncbi:hypothetical protein BPNPMPFG_006590 (plasmid) [Mesorhizobium sp. AR07]|uniref:hypothetical protein n=1 Tax=Mesorhizobium sp. AR07 TaxID=2865838 RepID=UPI00215EFAA7|nr:hypothetical protein [Mesorhizobium sp. AR07]UVK48960.1 hypothetical protein BPNPMPFG_006590 [Mesorhizobium sp. AR07]
MKSAYHASTTEEETVIDVNLMREREIAFHGLTGADEEYTIYYDETNNIRRLHVRSDGLNVREPKCFVVGGVAHHGTARPLPLDGLRSVLRVQPNAPEIKLKHVATGEFPELLKRSAAGVLSAVAR